MHDIRFGALAPQVTTDDDGRPVVLVRQVAVRGAAVWHRSFPMGKAGKAAVWQPGVGVFDLGDTVAQTVVLPGSKYPDANLPSAAVLAWKHALKTAPGITGVTVGDLVADGAAEVAASAPSPVAAPAPVAAPSVPVAAPAPATDWAAMVPSGQVWHPRKGGICGWSEREAFARAEQTGRSVLIEGPTGTGKTSVARWYAQETGRPFLCVDGSGALSVDALLGYEGIGGYVEGSLTATITRPSVISLNEINFIAADVLTAIYELLAGGTVTLPTSAGVRTWRKHAECLIIASQNPGYAGSAMQSNDALRRRFGIIDWWGSDPKVEARITGSPALVAWADAVRASDDVMQDLATPTLAAYAADRRAGFPDQALSCLLNVFSDRAERSVAADLWARHAGNIAADFK